VLFGIFVVEHASIVMACDSAVALGVPLLGRGHGLNLTILVPFGRLASRACGQQTRIISGSFYSAARKRPGHLHEALNEARS